MVVQTRRAPRVELGARDLRSLRTEVEATYLKSKGAGLDLDMTRGKPSGEQLDLSSEMLTVLGVDDYLSEDGIDCRNYGGAEGLPEARRLFARYLEVAPEQILVQDNSSLRLMHDVLAQALLRGVPAPRTGSEEPWIQRQPVRFLCPVPGYDRHFGVCEHLGVEMIAVPLGDHGPDLEMIRSLVAEDPSIRGMFCVPKYSNPTGITYSEEVVTDLAAMPTAAPDFRVFWDNAYAVHDLDEKPPRLANFLQLCAQVGHPDRPFIFGSTSKISFGGAGLSLVAASPANIEYLVRCLSKQTIGPNKLNQLRHVRFFKSLEGIREHMRRHAAIIGPKFDVVCDVLEERLSGLDIAEWQRPKGGYFISLDVLPGCAKRVVQLAADAGLKLTAAGATYPYGKDPEDRNLRLAPTYPSMEEVEKAARLVADCVILAAIEKHGWREKQG